MNRNEFDRKFPKGTSVAALNAKLGAVIARAGMYITRARGFKENDDQYKLLMFSAEKLFGYAQKMGEELKSLIEGAASATVVVAPKQQEILDAVEDCIGKKVDAPEDLWEKFWAMFGGEIESKYGA